MSAGDALSIAGFRVVQEVKSSGSGSSLQRVFGDSLAGIAARQVHHPTIPDRIVGILVIGRYLDAIYPMVYPSHFGPGEYNLDDPNSNPGATVAYALRDFNRELAAVKSVRG